MTPNTNTSSTVEGAHLRGLIATGPGHALIWDGRDMFIGPADMADHGTLLEITTQEQIATTLANDARPDTPSTLDRIAATLAETARQRMDDRRQIELQMSVSGPYSAALRPYGIHGDQLSHIDPATGDIATRYRMPNGATATLAMPYFRDSITPTTITITPATTGPNTTPPGTGTGTGGDAASAYTATVPRQTPPAAVAALIATAAGLTPHTARRYPSPNATGLSDADTTPQRLTITPAYARALAAHGPGWAIMWNDTHAHPVITRPEHGDDGHLLDICLHERMFTLSPCNTCDDARTCETCTSAQPDFETIAADMSDILGDYHLSLDDITAYMPLTLPYTRALRAHRYQRQSQGTYYDGTHSRTVHHDAYGQDYRSPHGHLVEVIVPIHPGPAATPTPKLIIRWTYLGRTTPDDTYPTTHIPADTPPTDVAELITTHLAIHPPTTTHNRTTDHTDHTDHTDATDATDATDEPDSPATPATT
ncbi:hypothetical protein ACIBEJ_30480 [Nonomuraea sp. NPDC050790]|uniref:hypothetical protein n=1 Tax=Nonomuraea sp. NPDC050790 TaxID=3364371 RepID=UPI0037A4068B